MSTILVSVLAGITCGLLMIFIIRLVEKPQGVFRVNTTDPNKDVYRIELSIPLGAITKYKVIRLLVIDDSESRE